MLEQCHVGRASTRDAGAVLSLVNLVQPDIPWTLEHLAWQHFETPAGESFLYVIRSEERIVALYTAVPKRLLVEGKVEKAFMVQDVMTHPQFRGRGFLNHLAGLCTDDLSREGYISYTFPNKLSENSFRRSGWTELMRVPFRKMFPKRSVKHPKNFHPELVKGAFDDRVTEIWAAAGFSVGVHRDKEFLNWRYGRPNTAYDRFIIGDSEGFLVLKIYDSGNGRTVHICDLVVIQDAFSLVPKALKFTEEFAVDAGADQLTCWLPSCHPYAQYADTYGLTLCRTWDRVSFVLASSDLMPVVSDPNRWHLTQGDSDVY